MSGLAASLVATVERSLTAQAAKHGRKMARAAIKRRAESPMAVELLATFTAQIQRYSAEGEAAVKAGDHKRAKAALTNLARAARNKAEIDRLTSMVE